MSKKLKLFLSCVAVCVLCLSNVIGIQAAEGEECIEGSYLIEEDYSEGTSKSGMQTWGVYLGSGTSSIAKVGTGKIAAGGRTVGQRVVNTISVTVRVERLVNGKWVSYTSWTTTKSNSAIASSSKTLSVPTGYYYRVYCIHKANSDVSDSITDGIYI